MSGNPWNGNEEDYYGPEWAEQEFVVTHACPPDGAQATPCCGKTPFDLPRTNRITEDASLVTCSEGETDGSRTTA